MILEKLVHAIGDSGDDEEPDENDGVAGEVADDNSSEPQPSREASRSTGRGGQEGSAAGTGSPSPTSPHSGRSTPNGGVVRRKSNEDRRVALPIIMPASLKVSDGHEEYVVAWRNGVVWVVLRVLCVGVVRV